MLLGIKRHAKALRLRSSPEEQIVCIWTASSRGGNHYLEDSFPQQFCWTECSIPQILRREECHADRTKRCALCHKLPTQHYPYTIIQSPSSHHPIILDLLTYHCVIWTRLIRSLRTLCVQDNDCAFVTCFFVPRSGIASLRRCSLRIQSPCGSWKAWNMSISHSLNGSHCARVTLGGAMVSTDSPEMGTR